MRATARTASSEPAARCTKARDRKSTRLNSSHLVISYAVFCLKKKIKIDDEAAHEPGNQMKGPFVKPDVALGHRCALHAGSRLAAIRLATERDLHLFPVSADGT